MLDIIIKNGTIYDGSGTPPFKGDIGISHDKIVTIAKEINEKSHTVLDIKNLQVSPGFVDVHSHSDYYLLVNPLAESKVRQGVTTEIGGNCGYSPAPIGGNLFKERQSFYKQEFGIDIDFTTIAGFTKALTKQGTSVNFAALIGHNTVRGSVMGMDNRLPTTKEIDEMSRFIDEGMAQGAVGLSLGLIYPPSCYSEKEELISLSKIAAKRGGVLATHIRSEGRNLIEAITEVIQISEEANIPLQISHLKTSGKNNWYKIEKIFELIEAAIDRGVEITCDRYPYLASNTGLISALPEWVYEGGVKEVIKRLQDSAAREQIKHDLSPLYPEDASWERVMISQVVTNPNKRFEGKTVRAAASLVNKGCTDFVFDLLIEEETHIEAIYFSMCEENLKKIIKKPYIMIGSDSGARADYGPLAKGTPHPRTFGTFPKTLRTYAHDKNIFSLATAIAKMTSLPCKKFNLKGRGELKEGMFADIVVFDINTLDDRSTYADPYHYPTGIKYMFVNGKFTIKDGSHTGCKVGRVLTPFSSF